MMTPLSFQTGLLTLFMAMSFATLAETVDAYRNSTLIVDEIPGRINGDDDFPPGRLVHYAQDGRVLFETNMLKMPYDAARMEDGSYWVSLIRENALWRISTAEKPWP